MIDRIRELPQQVRDAWALVAKASFPEDLRDVRDVTLLGMGGSAIGSELAAALLADELNVPVAVHRDYGVPGYVGKRSLVIASSHSGDTEETLSGAAEALERQARLIAVTGGGKLAALAEREGLPLVRFRYPAKPRAALGWSLTLALGVLSRVGLVRDLTADVATAVSDLEAGAASDPEQERRWRDLARAFHGRVVGVYGAGVMGVMARRWKGQWNENAKNWSFFDVLPELDHNAVVGFPHPERARELLTVVLLRSARDHPRNAIRFDVTRELLERERIPVEAFRFEAPNALAEVLEAIWVGDHISFELALLNGADPTPNTAIDHLKARLEQAR